LTNGSKTITTPTSTTTTETKAKPTKLVSGKSSPQLPTDDTDEVKQNSSSGITGKRKAPSPSVTAAAGKGKTASGKATKGGATQTKKAKGEIASFFGKA
jgi:hypothetical protein